jgi:hypothetical protein
MDGMLKYWREHAMIRGKTLHSGRELEVVQQSGEGDRQCS